METVIYILSAFGIISLISAYYLGTKQIGIILTKRYRTSNRKNNAPLTPVEIEYIAAQYGEKFTRYEVSEIITKIAKMCSLSYGDLEGSFKKELVKESSKKHQSRRKVK